MLYVGRVEEYKGVAVLARAFKRANRDNLSLHIAGSGDFMKNMQAEFKSCDNLKFYGWVSGAEKEELFLNSDVCVLPSTWYDNAPLVILEAYKYGLPVIGSRIGGIPEMVREGETGFLFAPGDEKGLAALLQDLSKEQLRKMEPACQQAAMEHSMERHIQGLMRIYGS
jgi:glycosyltransferase involved in cell wall biosynthesis